MLDDKLLEGKDSIIRILGCDLVASSRGVYMVKGVPQVVGGGGGGEREGKGPQGTDFLMQFRLLGSCPR